MIRKHVYTSLCVIILLCMSCTSTPSKPTSHVEEFGEFKIDIPNQFWYRNDDMDTIQMIQKAIWKEHNGTLFALELHHNKSFYPVPNLFINIYEESFLKSAKSKGFIAQEIIKTDSTWQCKYYLEKGLYINHYFGAKKVGTKYITYNYTGLYSFEKLLEILNSIKPWEKQLIDYATYLNANLGCSISYPAEFCINDTTDKYKNHIIKFQKKDGLPHENFNFSLSKGKYYDDYLIDDLILGKYFQMDSSLGRRYIINNESGQLKENEIYSFSDMITPSYMPHNTADYYLVYFIKYQEEYYILKFGKRINEIIYKNANTIKDILNSLTIN